MAIITRSEGVRFVSINIQVNQIPPELQMTIIISYNSVGLERGHLQSEKSRFTNRS